jgi:hypothetical protein
MSRCFWNLRMVIGPRVQLKTDEMMVRMLAYLGATQGQITGYEDQRRRWGQGSSHLSVLACNRKNLLKLDLGKAGMRKALGTPNASCCLGWDQITAGQSTPGLCPA